MAANNMNNLTTLIKRLEAATSRLEDIAATSVDPESTTANGSNSSAVPPAPPMPTVGSTSSSPAKPVVVLPPSVEAFDTLLNTELKAWLDLSTKLGGVIDGQAKAVKQAFDAQRVFLLVATKAKKPDMGSPKYMDLLKDITQAMSKVSDVRQSNREPALKDPLSMVADGVDTLSWITIESKPADHVTELFGGAQMYGNKVLKEYKEKPDRSNVEWVQAYYKLYKSLAAYVKQYHLTGVAWNKDGIDASEALKEVKSSAAGGATNGAPAPPAPAGAIPPPPGPPPPPMPPAPKAKAADMGAVFSDLNKGENVTKGLKKVDQSQMTHKNPSLRATAPVPERSASIDSIGRSKSPAPPGKKPKPQSMRTKKPPRKELDGNKWIIDNFDAPGDIVEIDAEINHSVLISGCKSTTIRINGKANAISLDNSSRTSLIIDSLVSSVDVIKAPNFALQVLGTLPTVLMDQVDGAQIYLSKDSLATEIFTSKCTSININLPPEEEGGDYTEAPIPEQFRSYIKNGKLLSEIVEHAG
ncbi:adenylyl cyclase-associated protein [Lophium mytilinum]|uniref:Adenylyl cyclase-associated protein n=1 Tax=Lophium mytilinum TaxID=390894 RepID=A0A6A6RF39_9PEZI|nr:adenylyl cyclase-associated protein [Lophium mytilinum]